MIVAQTLLYSAHASLSDDGELIAVSNLVSGFDIYSMESETTLYSFGHSVETRALRNTPVLFIHGGFALVGGSSQGNVHIWDIRSGRKLHSLLHDSEFCYLPSMYDLIRIYRERRCSLPSGQSTALR